MTKKNPIVFRPLSAQLRDARRLVHSHTQAEAAEWLTRHARLHNPERPEIDISQQCVANWETGRVPRVGTSETPPRAAALAAYIGITPPALAASIVFAPPR